MKLKIRNLAKIREADLVLEGITVVAGYNSTGKSTISKALVSCMSAYSNLGAKIKNQRVVNIARALEDTATGAVPELFYIDEDGAIGKLARKLVENREVQINKNELVNILERGLNEENQRLLKHYIEEHFEELCTEIEKKRDVPDQEYASFIVNNQFRTTFDQQMNTFGSEEAATIDFSAKEDIHLRIENNRLVDCPVVTLKEATPFYIEPKHMLDESAALRRGYRPEHSLYKYLMANEIISTESMTLDQYTQREHSTEIVKVLVDNVMHGSLRPMDNAVRFYDNDFQANVSVKNTASGIKSMALTARLVENGELSQKGMLIIDEPEVNLHPEWQLRFANFLVQLSRELEIQILLTTHSPYFLRAIEVYSKDCGIYEKLKLYMTEPSSENKNLYALKDVTENSNLIFKQLYMPLEEL